MIISCLARLGDSKCPACLALSSLSFLPVFLLLSRCTLGPFFCSPLCDGRCLYVVSDRFRFVAFLDAGIQIESERSDLLVFRPKVFFAWRWPTFFEAYVHSVPGLPVFLLRRNLPGRKRR